MQLKEAIFIIPKGVNMVVDIIVFRELIELLFRDKSCFFSDKVDILIVDCINPMVLVGLTVDSSEFQKNMLRLVEHFVFIYSILPDAMSPKVDDVCSWSKLDVSIEKSCG